ncbi:MAG: hypothetical protein LBD31_05065 [Treponema sp.]|jgi:hypothetical protein|nr:hypothetical protein [Treponema sp.]
MDDDAAAWLRGQAERAHTSVGQIIAGLVREKIAASQQACRPAVFRDGYFTL